MDGHPEQPAGFPLLGKRIAVLRAEEQAKDTAELLRHLGAEPLLVPMIEIHPPPDRDRLRATLRDLARYDLVTFTSTNGVDRALHELRVLGLDAREFGSCLVAAIGDATARRLVECGVRVDVKPSVFQAEALAESVLDLLGDMRGRRVLILRALEARDVLPVALRNAGVEVDDVAAYRTVVASSEGASARFELFRELLASGKVDAVLLTSNSTVAGLCASLGDSGAFGLLAKTCLASIGPITTAFARGMGLEVRVEARSFTIPGVVKALEEYFS